MEPTDEAPAPSPLAARYLPLEADNGMSPNGLSANGLSANGLSANGLSANGLSANGLSMPSFTSWFTQNPAQNDMVMRYIVRCAVHDNEFRQYRDPQTQLVYTWSGGLGLAPGWAHGAPANLAEQQLVSACLAAHVNKFGMSVPISVLGKTATGQYIPVTLDELLRYTRQEGCFFGNLFNGEGVFAGSDGPRLQSTESSSRACAFSSGGNACPPIVDAGRCDQLCEPFLLGGLYVSCTYNGVTYKPLTTRISQHAIYRCGDGVCQFTESCGRGSIPDSCEADCGRCTDEN
ncbi:hypothetical protein [Hyalangium minutum]|uniref:hypothetical protein n=1 Tax=Hyalangium minutum TaxID=394096 RepID=UPI001F0B6C00|nr:hypothetical protein [Hyalangium minutum]